MGSGGVGVTDTLTTLTAGHARLPTRYWLAIAAARRGRYQDAEDAPAKRGGIQQVLISSLASRLIGHRH